MTDGHRKKILLPSSFMAPHSRKERTPNLTVLPNNPCELFYQLSKLLAATKAGHNNTYNQVNAICKRLMELKLISYEKYRNILKKYYKR